MSRPPVFRPARVAVMGLAFGLGSLVAVSLLAPGCASGDRVGGYSAFEPAPSQQRAEARREREARKKALAELSAKPDASVSAPPPLPPPPPPPPEPEVEDAGVADAAPADDAAADAAVTDAAPPEPKGPTDEEGCRKVCDRAVACVKEIFPPGFSPPGMDIDKECMDRCTKEAKDADASRKEKALKCLELNSCEKFMDCIQDVKDKK